MTAIALGMPLAISVVPSIGSTATSHSGPWPSPTCSPLKSMGAWSFSPSPITTTPFMLTVPIRARMASTAAPSPPFLSPRPTHRPAAIAAASVTRTSSMARLRSGAGRSPRERAGVLVGTGPSGRGRDTGPPDGRRDAVGGVGEQCCDPRGMPEIGQQGQHAGTSPTGAPPAPPVDRMQRFTASNMIRSLLPLVLACLLVVGITALRQNPDDPVQEVETTSAERAVSQLASYPLLVPRGLSAEWRATSVRTNAGSASAGDPVTLQIGWFTPEKEFAEYVVSDDA